MRTEIRRVINSQELSLSLSPVGTRMVNAGCISKKPRHNALQDHIRVACAKENSNEYVL